MKEGAASERQDVRRRMIVHGQNVSKFTVFVVIFAAALIGMVLEYTQVKSAAGEAPSEREHLDKDLVLCIATEDGAPMLYKYPRPRIWAEVTNQGESPVKLARPGDGSWRDGRTPKMKWVVRPVEDPQWAVSQTRRGCGNMNRIERRCIFVLNPGESRRLSGWDVQPKFPGPGKYYVHLEYVNDPDFAHPATRYARGAKRRLESSDKVKLESNAIIIRVME